MSAGDGLFDLVELSRRIDNVRTDRQLTWVGLSKQVGVAASTIRRFSNASDAEADGVLALVGWLGVAPERFVVNSTVAGELLPLRGDGVIRVDMALVAPLLQGSRRARPGSRTTIQRLVATAQTAEVSVASLTRWSPI